MLGRSKARIIEVLRGLNPQYFPPEVIVGCGIVANHLEAGVVYDVDLDFTEQLMGAYPDHELCDLMGDTRRIIFDIADWRH